MLYQDHQRPALSFSHIFTTCFSLHLQGMGQPATTLPPQDRFGCLRQKDVNDNRDLVAVSGCYGGFMGNQQIWGYDGNYVLNCSDVFLCKAWRLNVGMHLFGQPDAKCFSWNPRRARALGRHDAFLLIGWLWGAGRHY